MERLLPAFDVARRLWQRLGPYIVIELLLPGGSLIALTLFLYRHAPRPALTFAGMRTGGRARPR
jgi:hypothetical protein